MMIDKLKFLIDQSENNPKVKDLLLTIAKMPENKQETTLDLIEMIINNRS